MVGAEVGIVQAEQTAKCKPQQEKSITKKYSTLLRKDNTVSAASSRAEPRLT